MRISAKIITPLFVSMLVGVASAQPVFEVVGQSGENLGVGIFCDGTNALVGVPGRMSSTINNVGEARFYNVQNQTLQQTISYPVTVIGAERFGQKAIAIGDINNDNQLDYAISAPGAFSGQVFIYTNLASSPTYFLNGSQSFEEFGKAIAVIGDVTSDGFPEILVSAPGRSAQQAGDGVVMIYDVAGGPSVWATFIGASAGEGLGEEVVVLDDYDADGRLDFAASAPSGTTSNGGSGLVRVYSGNNDLAVLTTLNGAVNGERFGAAIAAVGDLDGDGLDELLVGAPDSAINGAQSGRAVLYSGAGIAAGSANPQTLCLLSGSVAGDQFGAAVQGVGDVDGDGRREFAIGAPGSFQGSGSVVFYEYNGTSCIQEVTLQQGSGGTQTPGDGFGSQIAGSGAGASCDLNSDNIPDYIISSIGTSSSNSQGRAGFYLGAIAPQPTPSPTPGAGPNEPDKAIFDFKIDENGKFTSRVKYNRTPSPACTATLMARVYAGGTLSKPVALDTLLQLKSENIYSVANLPKARKVGEKKPVVHMITRTTCGAQSFDSNVFARFMNCGNKNPPVQPTEWLSILHEALKGGSSASVSVVGNKKVVKGKVKPRSVRKYKK